MRTYTLNNTVLTYPNKLVFDGDRNVIEANASSPCTALGVKVCLQSDESVYVQCMSQGTHVVIDITEFLQANLVINTSTMVKIYVYETGGTPGFKYVDFITNQGRTMPYRIHGSTTIVHVPWMYSTNPSNVSVDILANQRVMIGNDTLSEGVHHVQLANPGYEASINVRSHDVSATFEYGEIWDKHVATSIAGLLVNIDYIRCLPKNGIIVRYTDTDGCVRYASGQVLVNTVGGEHTVYKKRFGAVNAPHHHIDAATEILKVGFDTVQPGEYLEDIMLSDDVSIVECGNAVINDVAKIMPTTMTLERDGETKDIVITFKML